MLWGSGDWEKRCLIVACSEPRHCTDRRSRTSIPISRVRARGERWRVASVLVSRGAGGRATRDAVVGMWCSGDARCGGGWRRPARLPWRTSSCGGWPARSTRATPAASACPCRVQPRNCASPSPASSGFPSCATWVSCAGYRPAWSSTAATLTTGAASASPVRVARPLTRATSAWSKHQCRISVYTIAVYFRNRLRSHCFDLWMSVAWNGCTSTTVISNDRESLICFVYFSYLVNFWRWI